MVQSRLFFVLFMYASLNCQSIKELIDSGALNPDNCVSMNIKDADKRHLLINLSSKKISGLDGFNEIVRSMENIAGHHSPTSKRKRSVPPSIDWSTFSIELNLSHNDLVSLHEASFINLCAKYPLASLDVSHNKIKSLDQKFFVSNSGLAHLVNCSFAHNQIAYIPKDFLQNSLAIASLDLSHNLLNQKMVNRITGIAATKPALKSLKLNNRKVLKKHTDHLEDDDTHSQNSDGSLDISI